MGGGGAPIKLFGGIMALAVLAAVIMIKVEPYRMARIGAFLDPWADAQGAGYQAVQGQIAMGSGGWFGVGLGESRQKWSWLPHGESDFIFAILGEELGLMGTLIVVALFGLLGYAGLRVAVRVNDAFTRLAAAAMVAWVVGQATVNMGGPCWACCRSPASPCRWSRTAARPCCPPSPRSACCCRSRGASPARARPWRHVAPDPPPGP
ncbi:hypothetical protein GCM10020001_082390 [Nonomuraea salmonea]